MTVGIIGAGAAGMAAAISAAENPNVQVVLFERQARVGRKLQATGNGRCNLTNRNASPEHYHGADDTFVASALAAFNADKTLQWFSKLGLVTVTEPSGKVYPYSDQANSVVDILRFALQKPNITLLTGTEVKKIRCNDSAFCIETDGQSYTCDKLVIACGGLAGTKLGGSMYGYKLLGQLGHKTTKLRPSLVQLKSDWPEVSALKGVRANCHAQILHNGAVFSQSTGEIQFTQYGLSGPVIFEISRDVCQASGSWDCRLDFMPDMTREQLFAMLNARRCMRVTCQDLLTGLVHNQLGRILTKAAGIRAEQSVGTLTDEELLQVCENIKAFCISVKEPLGMDAAQVTAGGVQTADFDPMTMQSRLVPGLYACGEVLDIDGDCGGYNLQWAWSSGRCAGLHIGGIDHDSNS